MGGTLTFFLSNFDKVGNFMHLLTFLSICTLVTICSTSLGGDMLRLLKGNADMSGLHHKNLIQSSGERSTKQNRALSSTDSGKAGDVCGPGETGKSQLAAFLLQFFLGGFGAGVFYLGHLGLGAIFVANTVVSCCIQCITRSQVQDGQSEVDAKLKALMCLGCTLCCAMCGYSIFILVQIGTYKLVPTEGCYYNDM